MEFTKDVIQTLLVRALVYILSLIQGQLWRTAFLRYGPLHQRVHARREKAARTDPSLSAAEVLGLSVLPAQTRRLGIQDPHETLGSGDSSTDGLTNKLGEL